jgi:hypothetical protein
MSNSMPPQVAKSGSGGLMWGSLALLAALGGGGYFALSSRAPAAAVTPAASLAAPKEEKATPKPAEVQEVRIAFGSTPAGAKVSRPDGDVLGTTPFEKSFKKGDPAIDVVFILSGHERATRTIATDKNREVMVSLVADAPVAAPPAAAPAKVAASPSRSKPARPARSASSHKAGGEDDMRLLKSSLLEN